MKKIITFFIVVASFGSTSAFFNYDSSSYNPYSNTNSYNTVYTNTPTYTPVINGTSFPSSFTDYDYHVADYYIDSLPDLNRIAREREEAELERQRLEIQFQREQQAAELERERLRIQLEREQRQAEIEIERFQTQLERQYQEIHLEQNRYVLQYERLQREQQVEYNQNRIRYEREQREAEIAAERERILAERRAQALQVQLRNKGYYPSVTSSTNSYTPYSHNYSTSYGSSNYGQIGEWYIYIH